MGWGLWRGFGELDFRPCAQQMRHPPDSALFLSIMWPWTATHYTTSYLCLENSDAQWACEDLGVPPERHSLPGSIPSALTIPESPVSLSHGAHFTPW